jgi:hypothetical protein
VENGRKDIVEQPATDETKQETAHSLRARDVGASTTVGTFAGSPQERKKMVYTWSGWRFIRERLVTSGLKKGAAGTGWTVIIVRT